MAENYGVKDCLSGPNLQLELKPNFNEYKMFSNSVDKLDAGPSNRARPASSTPFARAHNIVAKDYYRHMKTDKQVKKHLDKKKAGSLGRAPDKTILDVKNARYKQMGEVISEQYARSQIPEARHAIIDKVVRMRGQHGRFGIDHSELINYELEQTNKTRDDYMNLLVYKSEAQTTNARDFTEVTPAGAPISKVLFNRLKTSDDERYSNYSQASLYGIKKSEGSQVGLGRGKVAHRGQGLAYQEWIKNKDMERRLKRKLTMQAKNDLKEELLVVAK